MEREMDSPVDGKMVGGDALGLGQELGEDTGLATTSAAAVPPGPLDLDRRSLPDVQAKRFPDVAVGAGDLQSLHRRIDEANAKTAVTTHQLNELNTEVRDLSTWMGALGNEHGELRDQVKEVDERLQQQGAQIDAILSTRPDSQDSMRRNQAADLAQELRMLSMRITTNYHRVAANKTAINAAQKSPEQLKTLEADKDILGSKR